MMNAYYWHLDPSPAPFPPVTGYARCGRQHARDGRHIPAHARPRVPLRTRAARAAASVRSAVLYPQYVVYRRFNAA